MVSKHLSYAHDNWTDLRLHQEPPEDSAAIPTINQLAEAVEFQQARETCGVEIEEEGWTTDGDGDVEESSDGESANGGDGDQLLRGSKGSGYIPGTDSSDPSGLLSHKLFQWEAAFREAAYEDT